MRPTALRMAVIALTVFVLALGPASTASSQDQPIYGGQLMTEQERLEYRERMRAASTEQERQQIRLEHHRQMQERARAMGVELPDEPSAMRMGQRMGPGQGGMGRGGGMGGGMRPDGGRAGRGG
jgi:hypothetical protein